ncbi:hypothetical protein GGR57DRAFT_264650 [Xylariaceae sp. FL1272]|nr:hypothetical protein GGR57DRAFT_264650 [Xylariaceae sp. FL1272]
MTLILKPIPHLISLPLEVRLLIYEYCAINYTSESVFFWPMRAYQHQPEDFPGQPALLLTCRQIFHEASPILHSTVHFNFQQNCGSIMKVRSCGPIVPSLVRSLHLDLDFSSCAPAISFLDSLFDGSQSIKFLSVSWTDCHIPIIRNDAYKTPLLRFVEGMEGLRVLTLTGEYGEDFLQSAKKLLQAEILAG